MNDSILDTLTQRLDRLERGNCVKTLHLLTGIVLTLGVVCGCASTKQAQFQEAIRKAARGPVTEAQGEAPALFKELAQSGGVAPTSVYVALHSEAPGRRRSQWRLVEHSPGSCRAY